MVDKDLSAALLASELGAAALLLLTDVDAVYEAWGTDAARPMGHATPAMLRHTSFPSGTMAPKVEAACRFVEGAAGERFAAIGALTDVEAILRGEKGTRIEPSPGPPDR